MYYIKRFFFYLIIVSYSGCIFGQKQLEKVYDAAAIQTVSIESDEVFDIKIRAIDTNEITVITTIEGESYKSSLLHSRLLDDMLIIETGRTPDFTPFNDKLSAHKVLSIVLEITVPQETNIAINSTLAQVEVEGTIGNLYANLGRGGCILEDIRFRESILINTISGNIYIKTTSARVQAQSRNGTVVIPEQTNDMKNIILESIYGDIVVDKSR